MKTYNEWLKGRDIGELSNGTGCMTYRNDSLVEGQIDQLVGRLEGLVYDLDEETKAKMIDRFIQQVESKILGL